MKETTTNHKNEFCYNCKVCLTNETILDSNKLSLLRITDFPKDHFYLICTKCQKELKNDEKKLLYKLDIDKMDNYETDDLDLFINNDNLKAENEENFILERCPNIFEQMHKLEVYKNKMMLMRKFYYRTKSNQIFRNLKTKYQKYKDPSKKINKKDPWLCGYYGMIIFWLNYFIQDECNEKLKKFNLNLDKVKLEKLVKKENVKDL